MFNSIVLNVFIGLFFIFLLYSLLSTVIQEFISSFLKLRAKTLVKGISRMLDDDSNNTLLSTTFYQHPLIKYLGSGKGISKPSYISGENFAKIIIDLLRGEDVKPGEDIKPFIQEALNQKTTNWGATEINEDTLKFLKSLWADSQGDIEKFSLLLEQWFDDTMERVSGWFKRKTQIILLIIGFFLAMIFNVDTISIVKKLSNDPKLAAQLADNASLYIQNHPQIKNSFELPIDSGYKDRVDNTELHKQIIKYQTIMDSANSLIQNNINDSNHLLGLGWEGHGKNKGNFSIKDNFHWWTILGWIITALAISLGAPFWFDILNNFMQLRSSKREGSVNK